MLEKIKKLLAKLGVDMAGKTDAEIKAMAQSEGLLETESPGEKPIEKNSADSSEILKQVLTELAGFKALTEKQQKQLDDREAESKAAAETALQARVAEQIQAAKKDGRIPAGTEGEALTVSQQWEKMLKADFAGGKVLLDSLPKMTDKNTQNTNPNNQQSGQSTSAQRPNTAVGSGVNPKILEHVNLSVPPPPAAK